MIESSDLKPNRTVFVNYGFVVRFICSLIFFPIAFAINYYPQFSVFYYLFVFVLLTLLNYYSLTVQYKKEKYIFFPNKIVRKGGGIFSDYEVELIIKNITHITMNLPFIENKLFKTGNISIESAGTGLAEVSLRNLENPKQIYEYIEEIMKNNGFKLTKSNLIQEESPKNIGVFFEVFKTFILSFFGILYLGFYLFMKDNQIMSFSILTWFIIIGSILSFLFIRSLFQFLDLKKRAYNLYEDTITYKEGFLSKNYSFIPIENLSDSTLTQTFIDKIFRLYDVKISCQGSKQEIHFKNMLNGQKLESNIGTLIGKTRSLVGTEKNKREEQAEIKEQSSYQLKSLDVDTKFIAEYRMDWKKTMFPIFIALPIILVISLFILAIPLLLGWIIYLIVHFIRVKFTKYEVKSKSIEKRYNFIRQKNVEFTNEKIMAVILKESFIDKWFNTCSIHFWSIGSAENIIFKNIKKTSGLYESILAKSGITPQDILYKMNSNFKILEMFKSTLPLTIISFLTFVFFFILYIFAPTPFFLIPLIAIIILYILIVIYKLIYYNRSKLTFFKDYIYFTRGIFFVEFYYVLYNNVKDITTVKYPFSKFGSITFNVAGEHAVQSSWTSSLVKMEHGKTQSIESNKFNINYIDDIDTKDELIDMVFYKRPNSQKISEIEQNIQAYSLKSLLSSKPDLANTLTKLILTSIIIFPLILLLPITLPLFIWWVKVKSYYIQPYRVIAKSGILYKKQISIVFTKIDHINYEQGMLNKAFKNGNISINTTGSSMPELTIQNISNFKEFYELLKKYY